MALSTHGAGYGYYSTAIVKVSPDATVLFECSIADMGQGQHTVQSQIVAEVLGVPFENVRIVCHDTDSTPFATKVHGSQGTWHQGKATYEAALSAKQQILALAAQRLKVEPGELDIHNARIYVRSSPENTCTFAEGLGERSMIIGVGQTFPDGREEGIYPREQATHFVDLSVDTETGKIDILRYVPVHYIGRALNPKIVEGQIMGAVYQGLESVLFGECITDPQTGKMLTYNWETYRPLTMLDIRLEPIMVEMHGLDPAHPFGAIACGEGAMNPVCATCGNALYNALGVRLKSTPFTPDKILKALGKL
jgi:xanthine dehydrogenase molybdenum-binding subunit